MVFQDMKIVYMSDVEEEDLTTLRNSTSDEIEIINIPPEDEDELIKRADEFDGIIGAWVPREFLEKADDLDYFIIPFAGIPEQDRKNLQDFPDLTVLNSHFNSWLVAEHAWSLLMASVKRLCPIHNKLKEGDWTPRYEHQWGWTLRDKTLLLLGYGEIGEDIAEIATAFDMELTAIKRTWEDIPELDELGTNEDMHDMLPKADFVICTLPHTEDTEGYLGKEEFEHMKDDAHLVNVGRGPVIDEGALYETLKEEKLGGVAIDTWWNYPEDVDSRKDTFPSNYDLDEFENVLFSPHRSSHVRERETYRVKDLAKILNSLHSGEIVNKVDVELGY